MVTQLGPEDLRVSKHHSTCLTAGITVTHPFKERNLRKLEKMARQAASAEPTQHAPIALRERAPQMSPDSSEGIRRKFQHHREYIQQAGRGMNWETGVDTYTTDTVHKVNSE